MLGEISRELDFRDDPPIPYEGGMTMKSKTGALTGAIAAIATFLTAQQWLEAQCAERWRSANATA